MLKIFNTLYIDKYMRNIGVWLITFLIAILFIVGITTYKMLESVVNPAAFLITLIIIFAVLFWIIIASSKKEEKKPAPVVEVE